MEKARSIRCGGRTVRYGAKGAKVMPGTPKGDAYCARSLGQMRDFPAAAKDPCSPLRLSRKRWACKGAVSMKLNPVEDDLGITLAPAVKTNPRKKVAPLPRIASKPGWPVAADVTGEDVEEDDGDVTMEIRQPMYSALARCVIAPNEDNFLALASEIRKVSATANRLKRTSWAKILTPLAVWIEKGMPCDKSDPARPAGMWAIFNEGNSKLPYISFSTFPGVTCPGAGSCLMAKFDPNSSLDSENPERKLIGGWCYSFKGLRYAAANRRWIGNTLLLLTPRGRAAVTLAWDSLIAWARKNVPLDVRLYVDGDFHSRGIVDYWMNLCERGTDVLKVYGYSKSWDFFLERQREGLSWPSNYLLNLSGGSRWFEGKVDQMRGLSFVRGEFKAVDVNWPGGESIPQMDLDTDYIREVIDQAAVKAEGNKKKLRTVQSWRNKLAKLISRETKRAQGISLTKSEKNIAVPEEFWRPNRQYAEMVKAAAESQGPRRVFVCPGKCGTCLHANEKAKLGVHACGNAAMKNIDIVIAKH